MKKLYYIRTNAYPMLVSVDEEKNCRYLIETEEFPVDKGEGPEVYLQKVKDFCDNVVEDDSSWTDDVSYEDIFETESEPFDFEILYECEKQL